MKVQIKNIPIVIEMPEFKILSPGVLGGMAVEYFEDLPDNKYTCPHWD